MSMLGRLEIMVDISSFQNIDLFHQGLYQVRVNIQVANAEMVNQNYQWQVLPYILLETENQRILNQMGTVQTYYNQYKTGEIKKLSSCDENSFLSKIFTIHFCEQFIDLEDICVFRIEYPVSHEDISKLQIKLNITLSHCEAKEAATLKDDEFQQRMCDLNTQTWILNNCLNGQSEHLSVIFDEKNFSVCQIYVHPIQINYLYKDSIGWSKKDFPSYLSEMTQQFQATPINQFLEKYQKQLRSNNEQYIRKVLSIQGSVSQDVKGKMFSQISLLQPTSLTGLNSLKDHNRDYIEICNELQQLINRQGSVNHEIWQMFMELYKSYRKFFNETTTKESKQAQQRIMDPFIIRNSYLQNDFGEPQEYSGRDETAKKIRSQSIQVLKQAFDLSMFSQSEKIPVIFEGTFQRAEKPKQQLQSERRDTMLMSRENHLVVFVHGFQGNSFDFRFWKNYLYAKFPSHLYLSSMSNENDTDQDIWQMGVNLAQEIKRFIQDRLLYQKPLKISIIGHSMGGIIARVAVINLDQYQKNLHTLITLACPHLGLGANYSKLIDTGVWILKKMSKECKSLDQLTMSDSSQLSSSLIWRISVNSKLHHFKNIILAYSYQDLYVPYESASLSRVKKDFIDKDKITNHNQLLQNIMCQLSQDKIIKLDVSFPILKKSLDTVIGRSSHIEFLDNQIFIRMFIENFTEYFS